jgi:hypothetical protein
VKIRRAGFRQALDQDANVDGDRSKSWSNASSFLGFAGCRSGSPGDRGERTDDKEQEH